MATSLDLARTYTSYSGVDIRVVINGAQVGSMQALSYAIQREKAPIYVMGSVDPISYSRGKRGIAGTMISLMMDTHLLMSPSFTGEYYLGDTDEIFPTIIGDVKSAGNDKAGNLQFTGGRAGDTSVLNNLNNEVNGPVQLTTLGQQSESSTESFGSSLTDIPGTIGTEGANVSGPYQRLESESRTYDVGELGNNYRIAPVFYVDQILPFDISIVAANEYGQSAQMRLYGCEILNEGSGFSIDDIVIENQMTYVCRTILPWRTFAMKALTAENNGVASNARDALYKRVGTATNRGGSIGASRGAAIQYAGK